MTDNEVIKALECCCTLNGVGCRNCPQYDIHSAMCVKNLIINVLDLINRQKAEIERLTDEVHRAKVEISKHFDYMDEVANEAIKEFAERLKEKYGTDSWLVIISKNDVDDLVKEMTEVQE